MIISMSDRINEFNKKIGEKELNAFLLTNPTNIYYFTDFFSRSSAYLLVIPGNTPQLYVPELELEEAETEARFCEVIKLEKKSEIFPEIKIELEKNQVTKLGIEDDSMNVKLYQDLIHKYEFPKLENGSGLVNDLRTVKDKEEADLIRSACQMGDKGASAAMETIEEGKTEIEIAAEVEYAMRKAGSQAIPFETIIASGTRSAFPHGYSSNKKIEQGDLIIIDLGAKYKGYCSDMTRTVVLGKPNPKQLELFNLVFQVEQNAIQDCVVGENAGDVEEKARKTLAEQNYEEYFVHSLGHGVGLDVHEYPWLSMKSKDVLAENNIFTIEPGVYIPDFGGIRIEDTILLKKTGPKILTKAKYVFEI